MREISRFRGLLKLTIHLIVAFDLSIGLGFF